MGIAGASLFCLKLLKQWNVRGAWIEGGEQGSELPAGIMTSAAGK